MICLTINKVVFNVTLHCRSSNRFVRPIKHSRFCKKSKFEQVVDLHLVFSFFSYSNKKALAL